VGVSLAGLPPPCTGNGGATCPGGVYICGCWGIRIVGSEESQSRMALTPGCGVDERPRRGTAGTVSPVTSSQSFPILMAPLGGTALARLGSELERFNREVARPVLRGEPERIR
jgi:hypothetical protein